jgi:hypothetical protein
MHLFASPTFAQKSDAEKNTQIVMTYLTESVGIKDVMAVQRKTIS